MERTFSATSILTECRKSLRGPASPNSAHYMDYLVVVAPFVVSFVTDVLIVFDMFKESDITRGESFPKLTTVSRKVLRTTAGSTFQDKETPSEVLDRKLTDEQDYAFYRGSGRVWITNGRGLISRLWLDYAVGIL